ncbi:MAG: cyclic nucleotide-binding domain-containing protein [Anaerolineae bacterium]|jgi:hypothetical protein|nr:cyclic nucleotide-binding domain-containing protein [Anaerolineae bacterium]MBT7076028.1 cyclic nucleotide-binding domain-containing protein [Anaerolineae bacterium]
MSKIEEYAAFLDGIHLFQEIDDDDDLFGLAEAFEEKEYEAGEVIFSESERASNFYLIYSGKVEITFLDDRGEKVTYVRGDYLGAEALISDVENSLVEAKDDVILLELQSISEETLPDVIELLRKKLKISQDCRKLIKEKDYDWLNDHEVIYFLKRKHIILFWRGMFFPAFLSMVGAIFLIFWWFYYSNISWTIGVSLLSISFLLVLWRWLDWRNDYYIITNQRLIWLEKIIGIYDSRQEANLGEVLSASVNTDAIAQTFFNYGKVSVRVMVGGMELDYSPHPEYAKYLIDELVERRKSKSKEQTKKEIEKAIKEKLQDPDAAPTKKKKDSPKKKTFWEKFFSKKDRHLFKQRFEEGGDIIYRKHWALLIKLIAIPLSISIFFILFFLYQIFLILTGNEAALSLSAMALIALAATFSLGASWYQYKDWSNDIFKVTKDEIFDIDKKPFGSEQKRSAKLEKIESLEYKREGIFSIFFNYGTVYIHIGAEYFEFEDVWNPASVQEDINRRYMEDHHKKEESATKKENDQMLDWFITYHQRPEEFQDLIDDLKKEQEEREFFDGEEE